MSSLWAVVALVAIFAAWDSIRRIFWAHKTKVLDERLKLIEGELPSLREKAGEAESYAKTISNRIESQSTQRQGRWVKP